LGDFVLKTGEFYIQNEVKIEIVVKIDEEC